MTKDDRFFNVVFAIFAIVVLALPIIVGKASEKADAKALAKAADEAEQKVAIERFIELRGMILEVKALSNEDISHDVLRDRLESITKSITIQDQSVAIKKHFTNKYLDDFAFNIPNTSEVGELCDELISQIEDQIHTIEYGAKGE